MSLGITSIVAHRGASLDAPENTLAAFRLAWNQGADGIEGDFRLTADGRIVCIHDEDTQRVAGCHSLVSETSAEDLRALDVGLWKGKQWQGQRVPLIEEVLAIVPEGKRVFLELKTGPEIIAPLAVVLEGTSLRADQIVIMSFEAAVVRACKERIPGSKCLWLTSFKPNGLGGWTPSADDVVTVLQECSADGLGSENRPEHVNDAFVERLRGEGIVEIHVWTVDEPSEARWYQRLGVTSIISNCPELLRRELGADKRES